MNNKIPNGIYNISDINPYSYNLLLEKYSTKVVLKIPKVAVVAVMMIGIFTRNRFWLTTVKNYPIIFILQIKLENS